MPMKVREVIRLLEKQDGWRCDPAEAIGTSNIPMKRL